MEDILELSVKKDWSEFDPEWYRQEYNSLCVLAVLESGDEIYEFYKTCGVQAGHSPNCYFDEIWYRRFYDDVDRLIQEGEYRSGFDHYCNAGYRDRNPNPFFDEKFYRASELKLSDGEMSSHGLKNGYDHYLNYGAHEQRDASFYFSTKTFISENPDFLFDEQDGPFIAFLKSRHHPRTMRRRLSWYFDPAWYRETYPDTQAERIYQEHPLAEYLVNAGALSHDPNPYFSEEFYRSSNPDVTAAIDAGVFHNAYEHFLNYGLTELRRPAPQVDLERYARDPAVAHDVRRQTYPTVFAQYVALAGALPHEYSTEQDGELACKRAFMRLASVYAAIGGPKCPDFTCDVPDVSIIMVAHNRFTFTMTALSTLRAQYAGAMQVILVDSGSSDETRGIENSVSGLEVIRTEENVGFLRGCNMALERVVSPFVLYLNNDVAIMPGAISAALRRMGMDPQAGAVGARIIRTNGLLQEAGSIIWRDGTTSGYLRNAEPDRPEANYVRYVDFCSGAFLLVRTEIVKQIGGFDPQFAPAYYEDTDLCVQIHRLGFRIVYDPDVVMVHYEFGTGDRAEIDGLLEKNIKIFCDRNRDYLKSKLHRENVNILSARSSTPDEKRILFIEDYIPQRSIGAGFPRSNDIIRTMVCDLGLHVTVYPVFPPRTPPHGRYPDLPDRAEVIWDRGLGELARFLTDRAGYYDILWLARTHNAERLREIINTCRDALGHCRIVLDTEAVASMRDMGRNRVLGRENPLSFTRMLQQEFQATDFVDQFMAVSETEASIISDHLGRDVSVLGHVQPPLNNGPQWADRRDLLFVGSVQNDASPNWDALMWLNDCILPLLDTVLPPEIRLRVVGHTGPGIDLVAALTHWRIDVVGAVKDLAPYYNAHRVFVAPTRFAAGIAYKIHEAAAHGLPIVATQLLCDQVGWISGTDMMTAAIEDPQAFAHALVRLYNDETLWKQIRRNALHRIFVENRPDVYADRIKRIICPEENKTQPL